VNPSALHDKLNGSANDENRRRKSESRLYSNAIVSELEARRYEDPEVQTFLSTHSGTLEEYRRSRNDTTYLSRLQNWQMNLREGFVGQTYPQ
jgi:hypothetical protein